MVRGLASRRVVAVVAAAAMLGVACSVEVRDGTFGCPDGRCPQGWFCHSDARCHVAPELLDASGPERDAAEDAARLATDDADMTDAGATDALVLDAAVPADAYTTSCSGEGSACTTVGGGTGLCCSARCIDPSSDPSHCGTCPTACSGGTPRCVAGRCAACLPGLDRCDDGVACTTDVCRADGSCSSAFDHAACPEATGPEHDCRGAPLCAPTGCSFMTLANLEVCRNGGSSREFCWSGVCMDSYSVCGHPSDPICCNIIADRAFCQAFEPDRCRADCETRCGGMGC